MRHEEPHPSGWDGSEFPAPPPEIRPGVRRRASARPDPFRLGRWRPDTRKLAMALGILAALGLLGATLSFTVDLFVAPWRLLTADVEESLHLIASAIGLGGALELYRRERSGRPLVLVSLAINLGATLIFSRATLGQVETFVPVLVWVGLAVAVLLVQDPEPNVY